MYRRKTYRRKAPKKAYKRKSYAPKRKASIKAVVKREIARNTENKTRQHYVEDYLLFGSGSTSQLDASIFPVTPFSGELQIDQGVGNGARIGNQIKTKRLTLKGTIVPLGFSGGTNPTPSPIQVKMWLFYDRREPTDIPTPAVLANFFQDNNAASTFKNDLVDLWAPVNTDRYRVLATRTFKLGAAIYDVTAGGAASQQYYANNDFKLNANFSIDLTKMVPNTVKFDDNNSDPTTRGLYCMCQVVRADGGIVTAGWTMARMSYMLNYTYEDA